MKRSIKKYTLALSEEFKTKLLLWSQQFEDVTWLDSNNYQQQHTSYQALLAVDAFTAIKTDQFQAFAKLEEYQQTTGDWLFGYMTYDLKNDTEQLQSQNADSLQFPDLYFFQPKKIFLFSEKQVELHYLAMVDDEMETDWQEINSVEIPSGFFEKTATPVAIKARTGKEAYLQKVIQLLQHIERGDVYEANLCQEFYAEEVTIDPVKTFLQLNKISRPPFASFFKNEQRYALSASPERYLKKSGSSVISQPIKGTARRAATPQEDAAMIHQLANDPKERSENIMITDLVRNDLSRIATKGSVEVDELCGIYTFEQVHHMISTITCEVAADVTPVKIIKNTFPMGSMTGAPKISSMQLIEKLEDAKRGLYSGTMGYFTPKGDFDFNVMIRSILYNAAHHYVSYSVGGAITAGSISANEYEECLLKAKAMRAVLEG